MNRYLQSIAKLLILCAGTAFAAEWKPVDPAELAQKAPKVDPAADAEVIFWDVKIEDRVQGEDVSLAMNHYIRVKIFTDRGKEQHATVEIPRFGKRSITDVSGRTIKPNGTIVELKKDAIFDRELVKTKGLKLKGKTFALPNVEVGDIIEYQYKEVRDNEIVSYMRLYYQREIPIWRVTYHLKPLSIPGFRFQMRMMSFQANPTSANEPQGFTGLTMKDVPAFKEEPYMPPEDTLKSWVLIYYEEDKKIDAEKFWKELGKQDFSAFKSQMKVDDQVKKTAAELVSGKDQPADKLAALDAFCRTKIRNLNSSAFHVTAEERKAFKDNRSPGDTLKQKMGTSSDVAMLFVALANASGFDARIARIPDRGDTFFSSQRPTTYFVNNFSVAVKAGEGWTFYDPATPYLEPGMLRWQEEGQKGLVSDPKEGFFAPTQYSEPGRSKRQRNAKFKLLEDGTLEGTVTYTYTGHVSRSQKDRYDDMTAAQQEEDWKDSLVSRLSTAEMSDFKIESITDPVKPVVVTHKVTVPGYATRTGKRILLQPAFFQRNQSQRFPEATRKFDMYFNYSWSEDDEVSIELPEGWGFDQPVLPASSKLATVGDYTTDVKTTQDRRTLIYRRHFDWGREKQVLIPVVNYQNVKKIFDFVQDQDNYTLTLKQVAQ